MFDIAGTASTCAWLPVHHFTFAVCRLSPILRRQLISGFTLDMPWRSCVWPRMESFFISFGKMGSGVVR